MAEPNADSDQRTKWRQDAVTGDISDDFLSLNATTNSPQHHQSPAHVAVPPNTDSSEPLDERQQQILNDEATARALAASEMHAQQPHNIGYAPGLLQGRLSVTVAQAKLAKNYGLMKMDPYCRLQVGHSVIEIPTCANGSKNPRWNKVVHAYLPEGVDTFSVEIYDEKLFAMDDRIAWAHVTIPQTVMEGQTVDDWFPLTGKQGDDKEGMINLIMTFSKDHLPPPNTAAPGIVMYNAPMYFPPPAGVPVYQQPPPQQTGPAYTEQDVKDLKEIVPGLDEEVIKSVLDSQRGNKEASITALLRISSDD